MPFFTRPRRISVRALIPSLLAFALLPSRLIADEATGADQPAATAPDDAPLDWQAVGDLLSFEFGDNTFAQYMISFGLLLATFVVRKIFLVIFAKRLREWTQKTRIRFDAQAVQAFEGPIAALIFLLGIFAAINVLTMDEPLQAFINNAFQVGLLAIIFWAGLRLIDLVSNILTEIAEKRQLGIYHFIPLIRKTARVFFVIIGSILIIQNLGYSVGSLLAGLGIGGLAIALAAQESLGNFFGSISIAADRTFKVGDWIQVGDRIDGNVEEIGLRSTKVRTWRRTLLTIPNKLIAGEVVENWSKMPNRRVSQVVGVSYETTRENMQGLLIDIEQLLRNNEEIDQKFIMVRFTEFGESSLDILVYYFTRPIAWAEHLRVRQEMNLAIMALVEKWGTSIAFPTRTLHLHPAPPQSGIHE